MTRYCQSCGESFEHRAGRPPRYGPCCVRRPRSAFSASQIVLSGDDLTENSVEPAWVVERRDLIRGVA